MLTLPLAAAFAASVLFTSFLSGIFGMAGGMILMGLLLAMLPLAQAMLLHGITQLASNGWRAWLWRDQVNWRIVRNIGLPSLLTAGVIALLPFTTDKATALIVLGLTPFLALLLPKSLRADATRSSHAWGCGTICTTLQLVAGGAGPILDLFFVHTGLDRKQVVATKAATQTLNHLIKIAYFGGILASGGGSFDGSVIVIAVGFAMTGTTLSRWALEAMSDANFRRWTQWIVLSTAAVFLVQGVWLLLQRAG